MHVVMGMNAQTFVRQMRFELIYKVFHILMIKASVRIDDIHHIHDALLISSKASSVVLHYVGEGHNVERSLVTTIMEGLYQRKRLIHVFNVTSDTDEIQQAFLARQNIIFIHAADIYKCRQFGFTFMRNDFSEEFIIKKTLRACLISAFQQFRRIL